MPGQVNHNQRKVAYESFFWLLVVLSVYCVVAACGSGSSEMADHVALDTRIDPNVAGIESLSRLPGIGITLASRIVEHRQKFILDGRRAFEIPADLEKVRGIGKIKSAMIAAYLRFD